MTQYDDIKNILGEINPSAIADYLISAGWSEYPIKYRNDIRIFQYDKNGVFERVTIPLTKSLRDYLPVMYQTVCGISKIEQKNISDILPLFY